jgi:hypothetical protein
MLEQRALNERLDVGVRQRARLLGDLGADDLPDLGGGQFGGGRAFGGRISTNSAAISGGGDQLIPSLGAAFDHDRRSLTLRDDVAVALFGLLGHGGSIGFCVQEEPASLLFFGESGSEFVSVHVDHHPVADSHPLGLRLGSDAQPSSLGFSRGPFVSGEQSKTQLAILGSHACHASAFCPADSSMC